MLCNGISPRARTLPAFRAGNRKPHGFTLLELLIVVLILSALMAIALPFYLSALSDSQLKTCRTNMQSIATSVQSARIRRQDPDYTALIAGGVTTSNLPDLSAIPLCPNGGVYTLSQGSSLDNTTFRVKCGPTGHGQYEPGVDAPFSGGPQSPRTLTIIERVFSF